MPPETQKSPPAEADGAKEKVMLLTEEQRDEALERIAQIDHMFEEATGWGSWMVMCANEREALVNRLRAAGLPVEHKYQARNADGSPTD